MRVPRDYPERFGPDNKHARALGSLEMVFEKLARAVARGDMERAQRIVEEAQENGDLTDD